ncbi:MAG TPA: sodium:proton antiporter [Rubricoccaceae bacterium]|jgi:Na+/H+ antiporter NhaD/arsenite permease-like protein
MTPVLALVGPGEPAGAAPPAWLVLPFVVLLGMVATGPLFYSHHWHRFYPAYAVGLGALTAAFYAVSGEWTPLLHAAEEYVAFIALLAALFVASGSIYIRTDFAGTPRANTLLLLVGAVVANLIGTTGASMLLIRPFLRINAGRLRPYHVVFFIFVVSNVGGALTPIGDPPLFLGFLRGVPFFWTLEHLWYIWVPTVAVLLGVFYAVDRRNTAESRRERAVVLGDDDVEPGEYTDDAETVHTRRHVVIDGAGGFAWLAVAVALVFLDPTVLPAVPDLHALLGVPFGLREILLLAVAVGAYRTASPGAMAGNHFTFEPIKEVAWLFVGIFVTMQPALELIRLAAAANASSLNATTFYFGTGVLSGVLDNAPTYIAFLSAAMGTFGLDVNVPSEVAYFAAEHSGAAESWHYLQAISVGAVFWGAMTYIGNGPNFMVKAIAENAGAETPSFVSYVVRYALPVLLPLYVAIWLVFFSGWIVPPPALLLPF